MSAFQGAQDKLGAAGMSVVAAAFLAAIPALDGEWRLPSPEFPGLPEREVDHLWFYSVERRGLVRLSVDRMIACVVCVMRGVSAGHVVLREEALKAAQDDVRHVLSWKGPFSQTPESHGGFLFEKGNPLVDGYCYVGLFPPYVAEAVINLLGPRPDVSTLCAYVSADTVSSGVPGVVCSLLPSSVHVYRGEGCGAVNNLFDVSFDGEVQPAQGVAQKLVGTVVDPAVALAGIVGKRGDNDAESYVANGLLDVLRAPAMLSAEVKKKVRMLGALGDAALTLCIIARCEEAGVDVQQAQEEREKVSSNHSLSSWFKSSPFVNCYSCVGDAMDVSPKVGGSVAEAIMGVVFKTGGLKAVDVFADRNGFYVGRVIEHAQAKFIEEVNVGAFGALNLGSASQSLGPGSSSPSRSLASEIRSPTLQEVCWDTAITDLRKYGWIGDDPGCESELAKRLRTEWGARHPKSPDRKLRVRDVEELHGGWLSFRKGPD